MRPRTSHPNMKRGQRKYRKLTPAEQHFEDVMWLASAKKALAAAPPDHPLRAEMEQAIAEMQAIIDAGGREDNQP